MAKGRVAWVFWVLVVLAVITSAASYAWLSMNTSAFAKGIAVNLASNSRHLQISANAADGYREEISFGKDSYIYEDSLAQEIYLTTYGYLPAEGGLRISADPITEENADGLGFQGGKYAGVGRVFSAEPSGISSAYSYEDVTADISDGESVIGLYTVSDTGDFDSKSAGVGIAYYFRHKRTGATDYVCVGSEFSEGETLSGRRYWGYAISENEAEVQEERMISVVSMDLPHKDYAMKKTAYIRTAKGSLDLMNLRIDSIKIKGLRNFLTDAIRIMFVARSSLGGEEVVTFYNPEKREDFDGKLQDVLHGDRGETVTVEIYIFFDGTHENASTYNGELSNHQIAVEFSVDKIID